MTRRLLVTACLAVVASGPAVGRDHRFTSSFYGFSAVFTHVPKEIVMDRAVRIDGREMLIKATQFMSWDKRGVSYVVGAFSFPYSIQTDKEISAYLQSTQSATVKSSGGRLLQSSRARLQNLPGNKFEYEFEQDGDVYTAYVHSVVVRTRAFNISVIAPKGIRVAAERETFVRSFKLAW